MYEVAFRHGALSDSYEDRANEQGYTFHANIGCFYKGLIRFKEMLERKAKDND